MRYFFLCLIVSTLTVGCVADPVETPYATLVVSSPALFARSSNGIAEGRYRDTIDVSYPDSSSFVLAINKISGDSAAFTVRLLSSTLARLHQLEIAIDTTIALPPSGHVMLDIDIDMIGKAEGKKDGLGYLTATYMLVGG